MTKNRKAANAEVGNLHCPGEGGKEQSAAVKKTPAARDNIPRGSGRETASGGRFMRSNCRQLKDYFVRGGCFIHAEKA